MRINTLTTSPTRWGCAERRREDMFEWWIEHIKEIPYETYVDMPYWLQMELLEEHQNE